MHRLLYEKVDECTGAFANRVIELVCQNRARLLFLIRLRLGCERFLLIVKYNFTKYHVSCRNLTYKCISRGSSFHELTAIHIGFLST